MKERILGEWNLVKDITTEPIEKWLSLTFYLDSVVITKEETNPYAEETEKSSTNFYKIIGNNIYFMDKQQENFKPGRYTPFVIFSDGELIHERYYKDDLIYE